MACPFFAPQRRLDPGTWTHLPRLPLGDPCFGFCQALNGASFAPPEEHQRELCNRGYARGLCEHFPASSAADAVRFSVIDDEGDRLRLVYVLEKDHAPLDHGQIDFDIGKNAFASVLPGQILAAQARAFVESYVKTRDLSACP
jgi:hypothetical protein